MKCLPATKLPASNGVGIHDWHAEVLALRAFNRYLLDECNKVLDGNASFLVKRTPYSEDEGMPPFSISEGVKLHMYCSEAPCT